MPALRDLQAAIRDALLGSDAGPAMLDIEGDGLSPEARLDIYRHHVRTTLTAALEATYGVVSRLVDRRFFAYAADGYVQAHPPAGPCLFEYGSAFPDFLASFPSCRHLAYLPDVARLEWAMNAAFHAPDVEPLDPARLAVVPPRAVARLTFTLDPSVTLIESRWPIDEIWRANQGGAAGHVDLASGGVRMEIRRTDGIVTMRRLLPADHALRVALAAGATLARAAAAGLAIDSRFDLTAALHDLLQERIATGFAVSN